MLIDYKCPSCERRWVGSSDRIPSKTTKVMCPHCCNSCSSAEAIDRDGHNWYLQETKEVKDD